MAKYTNIENRTYRVPEPKMDIEDK
jgi:hypothetical protein